MITFMMRIARHISVPLAHIAHGVHSLLRITAHGGNTIYAANHHDLPWEVLSLVLTTVAVVDLFKIGMRIYRFSRTKWTKNSTTKGSDPDGKA